MRFRRPILCALAVLLVAVGAEMWGSRAAWAAPPALYVTNQSALADAEVAAALPAFQAALDEDFTPAWGLTTLQLRFLGPDAPPVGSWRIVLVNEPDCWFCFGYHDVEAGAPHAVVGIDGDWQVTFSHELFELVGNPFIDHGVLVGRRWYAREAADPVEANALGYFRGAVHISDFVTLDWFRKHSTGPWDFTRACSRPLQILPDGYQLVWKGGGWKSFDRRPV